MAGYGRFRHPESNPGGTEWWWLSGTFGNPDVVPCNVDGMVERNGYFLFLERKQMGERMSGGQHLALKRMALLRDCTVVVVWFDYQIGQREEPEVRLAQIMGHHLRPVECDTELFNRLCAHWWHRANARVPHNGAFRSIGQAFDTAKAAAAAEAQAAQKNMGNMGETG